MIDYTLFGFTLAILVVGVWYACSTANISGEDDVEDDGRGNTPPAKVSAFASSSRARRTGGRRQRGGS